MKHSYLVTNTAYKMLKHHFWKLCIDMTSEEMYKNENTDLSNIEISKDVF